MTEPSAIHASPVVPHRPITELTAREKAFALLDAGTGRELLGPFDRLYSPHLAAQDIVAQSDDGAVIVQGAIDGEPALVLAVDGGFHGGGIGEVGGAKIAGALEQARAQAETGTAPRTVLILETGGIRLQEANLGLLAIAEIHAAITALRRHTPVVGVITGMIGCFGGMGIAAGLCSHLIMTRQGRLGLNGPEVIEQEAGVGEFDATDRAMIWSTTGGERRVAQHLADELADDDVTAVRSRVRGIFRQGPYADSACRSARVDLLLASVAAAAPRASAEPSTVTSLDADREPCRPLIGPPSAGSVWFQALSGAVAHHSGYDAGHGIVDSVLVHDGHLGDRPARFLAIVPDPGGRFPRARHGEVGLEQAVALASAVRAAVRADADAPHKRALVAVIDVPSQAYGRREEEQGIHQALAGAVDAYCAARGAGHPVVCLVVGKAMSGAFLAHGLQANRLVLLADEGVEVQAMSKQSTARVTHRTVDELDAIARRVPATAYDGATFATLGAVHRVVGARDLDTVKDVLAAAVSDVLAGPRDLSIRLASCGARRERAASLEVRRRLARSWNGGD